MPYSITCETGLFLFAGYLLGCQMITRSVSHETSLKTGIQYKYVSYVTISYFGECGMVG